MLEHHGVDHQFVGKDPSELLDHEVFVCLIVAACNQVTVWVEAIEHENMVD